VRACRAEVDHAGQIDDWRDAITFATTLPEIDAERIGLWGTSLGRRGSGLRRLPHRSRHRVLPVLVRLRRGGEAQLDPARHPAPALVKPAFGTIPGPKRLEIVPGHHYSAHTDFKHETITAATDWFAGHLRPAS
jgi:hypothetical protein